MAVASATEENKKLVRDFERDVFNGRKYDKMVDYQAPDFVQHGPMMGMDIEGNDAALENLKMYHAAFSDLESENLMMVAEGDYVVSYNKYTGTHDGEFMGIAPTNKTATVYGQIINRIEDGKVVEGWVTVDFLGLLAQVGVLPEELTP